MVLSGMDAGMSLRQSCASAKVPHTTFVRWCDENKELADQYARTRERLLDRKAEELEDIGERAATAESAVEVAGLRLLSDNRKWLLSKLMPKKYGERIQNEHSGTVLVGLAETMRRRKEKIIDG